MIASIPLTEPGHYRHHRAADRRAPGQAGADTGHAPGMSATRLVRLLVFALSLPLLAVAAAAQTDAATAETILRKSSLWATLGQLEPQVQASVARSVARAKTKPSPAEAQRVAQAATTAYAADRLRANALATIAQGADARHLPALMQWFDSPAGANFTRLEEQSVAEHQDPQQMVAHGQALLQSMPPSRRELIQKLTATSETAELMADVTAHIAIATQRGLASALPPDEIQTTEEQLRAAMAQRRPQLVQALAPFAHASIAVTYASAPASDLRDYIEFLQTDAGRHFNALVVKALQTAVTDAAQEFGRRLPGTRDKSNT